MKKTISGVDTPIALICINKSRLKVHHKETIPTYYLEKSQEFQIELFNPTSNTVLAKIQLNGKIISQGGLVLKPGQRIFLERYLDVAKKFMFDTYEVSDTQEVQKAIQNNGDLRIEFFNESIPQYSWGSNTITTNVSQPSTLTLGNNQFSFIGTSTANYANNTNITIGSGISNTAFVSSNLNVTGVNNTYINSAKSIETGRVEAGGNSNQTFDYVNKNFDASPFHSIEYKLLPISQKINTDEDINIKRYCHNCGAKQKKEHKFCPICGTKS